LIEETFAAIDAPEQQQDSRRRCSRALNQVEAASLAERANEDGALSVHSLVSRTVGFYDQGQARRDKMAAAAVAVLNEILPRVVDAREHLGLALFVTHARELVTTRSDLAAAELMFWLSRHDYETGRYASARTMQEQVLVFRRLLLGEEHPHTLTSMSSLAATLQAQGDLAGARQPQAHVLGLSRQLLGEKHPHTLTSMNNLAETLREQGDLAGARELHEQVLVLRRRLLGEEHPDTLTSMNNLAVTLQAQGDLAGARQLQEQVLALRRKLLGEEHPNTTISAWRLFYTMIEQGDHAAAQDLLERHLKWLLTRDPESLSCDQRTIQEHLQQLPR
jgi:hypothetical protein